MFLKKICRIMVVIMVLSFFGCAPKTKPMDPRVAIIDTSIARKLPITEVLTHTNPDGFMVVQITGRNYTSNYYKLEYKVDWLDNNGLLIKTILSKWTSFPAYEQTEYRFNAIAPKATAKDFRVKLREKGE